MTKPTIVLAVLLAAFAASAHAEPPTMEPLRRAAAGELAAVVDGSLVRDGAVRNGDAVKGALRAAEPVPTPALVDVPAALSRPTMAPPAPRPEEKSFFAGLASDPLYAVGGGALIGAVVGFFVGGGLLGALAGAAVGALLGWGLSKLFGGKKG